MASAPSRSRRACSIPSSPWNMMPMPVRAMSFWGQCRCRDARRLFGGPACRGPDRAVFICLAADDDVVPPFPNGIAMFGALRAAKTCESACVRSWRPWLQPASGPGQTLLAGSVPGPGRRRTALSRRGHDCLGTDADERASETLWLTRTGGPCRRKSRRSIWVWASAARSPSLEASSRRISSAPACTMRGRKILQESKTGEA